MTWTITPISKLAECADEWQRLNRAAGDSLLLDFRFVHDLVREFARGDETIAAGYEGDALQAIGIFQRTNRFVWQTLQPPNAPIGLWISQASCNIENLLRQLAPALSPQCAIVSLTQQDPPILSRPSASSHVQTLDYIVTPRLPLPSSFAEYLRGRSKNFRHNVTRQKNRLSRDNITARLEILVEAAGMAEAVSDYSRLECASWKGEINSAVRMDEPQGRFYASLLTNFAEFGEALVYRYFFGERLVASDLCLRRGDTLLILKTACDESFQGLSTAHLMRLDAFAELVDNRGIRTIEFYGPMKEWHARLTDESRQMFHINYYRWRIAKRLHEFKMARDRNAELRARAQEVQTPPSDTNTPESAPMRSAEK